jgi:DNA ligase D-like protein (predicted ligase)
MSQAEDVGETLEELLDHPLKTRQPAWIKPMLATLGKKRFYSDQWIYEPKLDGERCLTFKKGKNIKMYSRNHILINQSYPELIDALEKEPVPEFVVDGEIVAFEGDRTSFALLQNRMHVTNPSPALLRKVPVFYYIFDVIHLNGFDLTGLPLLHRKRLLRQGLDFHDPLRYLDHRLGASEEYFQEACRLGWEGLIAKRADSVYEPKRSEAWLKFKCVNEQEFVIGGYTDPQRSRIGFGSLLVGYYDEDGELRYAGKIGTGFSDRMLADLCGQFERMKLKDSPFADFDPGKKGFHWVEPRLVAQVAFTEWTSDGKLRHPRFLGLRRDKAPEQVRREG